MARPCCRHDPKASGESLIDPEMFTVMAADLVTDRPGHRKPRAVKRRPKPYPLLTRHRHKFRDIDHRDNRNYLKKHPRFQFRKNSERS